MKDKDFTLYSSEEVIRAILMARIRDESGAPKYSKENIFSRIEELRKSNKHNECYHSIARYCYECNEFL